MQRRSGILVLSLFLLGSLVQPAFAEDGLGLESWRERADEGNFAQEIAGVYLIRHHTDEWHAGVLPLDFLNRRGELGEHRFQSGRPLQSPWRPASP